MLNEIDDYKCMTLLLKCFLCLHIITKKVYQTTLIVILSCVHFVDIETMREYDVYPYLLSNKNLIRIPTKNDFFII